MGGKLTLTHGLPGSGKSTEAERLRLLAPETTFRVNRDDTRTELFGEKYHSGTPDRKSENQVTAVTQRRIREYLGKGHHVICDDTNLVATRMKPLVELARSYGAVLAQLHFNVPVDVCKARNRARGAKGGRLVPEFVIDAMAAKAYSADGQLKEFVIGSTGVISAVDRVTAGMGLIRAFEERQQLRYPIENKQLILVDLDGTLANNARDADLAFGVPGKRRNYGLYHTAAEHAPANEHVLELTHAMRAAGFTLAALSGRSDDFARETIAFLERIDAPVSLLRLKREGDYSADGDFKLAALARLRAEGFTVIHAIDDRPRVIQMWEQAGIMVSRVPYHEAVDPATGPLEYIASRVDTSFGMGFCLRCGTLIDESTYLCEACGEA